MSNRTLIATITALLLVTMLCICGGAGALFFSNSRATAQEQINSPVELDSVSTPAEQATPLAQSSPAAPPPLPSDALAIVQAEEQVLNQLYESSAPGVVNISVSGNTNSLLGDLGEGSGWVWDREGHIVTNNHVVEGAETVFVSFSDNVQVTATVVGTDENSDLAVLKVDVAADKLFPLPVGDSAALRVGQRVIAIGSPFGFRQTLTLGVVSGVGRTVEGPTSELGSFRLPNLIQTDAAINPGNSGGPLLDIQGRVVGVNTLIFSQTPRANSGVGFAVPVNKVAAVVPALIANGRYETPYLGLSFLSIPITPELAAALELQNVSTGILVTLVVEGGPAAQGGVRGATRTVQVPNFQGNVETGGDVVIALDGQPVGEFDDLVNYLDTRSAGDTITLTVVRGGETVELPVTLGARP